jgi:hypothetical protein
MFDMRSNTVIAKAIQATLSGTTPSKGNIVDMSGYQACTFAFLTGAVTDAGTASGFSFEIQESDTTVDGAFTAVADADLVGTEAGLTVTLDTDDGVPVGSIGYVGTKRYVRAVVTGTTATDAVINGVAILQRAAVNPPASDIAANIAAT